MNEILPFYQLLPINFIRCTEPNSNEVLNRKHHFFPFSVVYWEKKTELWNIYSSFKTIN